MGSRQRYTGCGNLKSLSALFDISVDYLLDDGSDFEGTAVNEAIDLSIYKKEERAGQDRRQS